MYVSRLPLNTMLTKPKIFQIHAAEEIHDAMTEALRDVRSLQNASLPITQLPPELLCKIFVMLRDDFIHVRDPASIIRITGRIRRRPPTTRELVKYDKLRSSPHPFSWMNIMRVCRRWNMIAQECYSLWSTMLFDDLVDFAPLIARSHGVYPELFLQRSASAPLQLSLSGSHPSCQVPGAHQLLASVGRARELHLRGSLLSARAKALIQPAPRLEALVLSQLREKSINRARGLLFDGQLPSLRSLAYINVRISDFAWSLQSSYSRLRQLYVGDGGAFRFADLLAVLRDTPILEDLFLGQIHSTDTSDLSTAPRVGLPKLQRLTVDYSGSKEPLFRALRLGHEVLLTLRGTTHCYSALLPRNCPGLGDLQHIKRVKLHYGQRLWRTWKIVEDCIYASGDASALQIFNWVAEDLYHSSLHLDSLMAEVEELWVEGEYLPLFWGPSVADGPLAALLQPAIRLRNMILNVERDQGLMQLLRVLRQPQLCPSLAVLEIRISRLAMYNLMTLRSTAIARRDAGVPLRIVRLGRHSTMQRVHGKQRSQLMSWQEWMDAATVALQDLVDELVFVDGEPVPRMPVPPICHKPSSGWQWSEWGDK